MAAPVGAGAGAGAGAGHTLSLDRSRLAAYLGEARTMRLLRELRKLPALPGAGLDTETRDRIRLAPAPASRTRVKFQAAGVSATRVATLVAAEVRVSGLVPPLLDALSACAPAMYDRWTGAHGCSSGDPTTVGGPGCRCALAYRMHDLPWLSIYLTPAAVSVADRAAADRVRSMDGGRRRVLVRAVLFVECAEMCMLHGGAAYLHRVAPRYTELVLAGADATPASSDGLAAYLALPPTAPRRLLDTLWGRLPATRAAIAAAVAAVPAPARRGESTCGVEGRLWQLQMRLSCLPAGLGAVDGADARLRSPRPVDAVHVDPAGLASTMDEMHCDPELHRAARRFLVEHPDSVAVQIGQSDTHTLRCNLQNLLPAASDGLVIDGCDMRSLLLLSDSAYETARTRASLRFCADARADGTTGGWLAPLHTRFYFRRVACGAVLSGTGCSDALASEFFCMLSAQLTSPRSRRDPAAGMVPPGHWAFSFYRRLHQLLDGWGTGRAWIDGMAAMLNPAYGRKMWGPRASAARRRTASARGQLCSVPSRSPSLPAALYAFLHLHLEHYIDQRVLQRVGCFLGGDGGDGGAGAGDGTADLETRTRYALLRRQVDARVRLPAVRRHNIGPTLVGVGAVPDSLIRPDTQPLLLNLYTLAMDRRRVPAELRQALFVSVCVDCDVRPPPQRGASRHRASEIQQTKAPPTAAAAAAAAAEAGAALPSAAQRVAGTAHNRWAARHPLPPPPRTTETERGQPRPRRQLTTACLHGIAAMLCTLELSAYYPPTSTAVATGRDAIPAGALDPLPFDARAVVYGREPAVARELGGGMDTSWPMWRSASSSSIALFSAGCPALGDTLRIHQARDQRAATAAAAAAKAAAAEDAARCTRAVEARAYALYCQQMAARDLAVQSTGWEAMGDWQIRAHDSMGHISPAVVLELQSPSAVSSSTLGGGGGSGDAEDTTGMAAAAEDGGGRV